MDITLNDIVVITLTEVEENVIKNDIPYDVFNDDIKRRIRWVLRDSAVLERNIKVNGEPIFLDPATLTEYNDERLPVTDEQIVEKCKWVLREKKQGCILRLFHEWVREPFEIIDPETNEKTIYFNKLAANEVPSIPLEFEPLATLIFAQDETKLCPYKCRQTRDEEIT